MNSNLDRKKTSEVTDIAQKGCVAVLRFRHYVERRSLGLALSVRLG